MQQQQTPTAGLPLAIDQKAAADLDSLLAAVRHPALVGCDRLFELSSWPPKGFPLDEPAHASTCGAGLLEHPFAAGNCAGAARIDFGGHAQRAGEGLEAGFNDVV